MDLPHLFEELKKQIEEDKKVTSSKTAILWGKEDLLGGAIKALLASLDNWKVIRVFNEKGVEGLIREVVYSKPDLLVINQNDIADDIHALLLLIRNYPDLRILSLNPANNLVEVYDKHLIQVRDISDLLSVIDEHPKSTLEGGDKQINPNKGSVCHQPPELEESTRGEQNENS